MSKPPPLPVYEPTMVFLVPVVISPPELYPMAVLFVPVLNVSRQNIPMAVFLLSVAQQSGNPR
jgi:hypothetical protein